MFSLQKPTTERVIATRTTSINAISTATIVRNRLYSLAESFDTGAVFALATALNPKAPLPEAIALLLAEVERGIALVTAHKKEFAALEDAEKERLKPIVRTATSRLFGIIECLHAMDNKTRSREGQELLERRRLEEAGLSPAEIAALRPPHDAAAERATREALTTEKNSLEAFLRQRDETLLPPGFVAELVA